MITRGDLLNVEKTLQAVISTCQKSRHGVVTSSAAFTLLVKIENDAHERVLALSKLTEGELKYSTELRDVNAEEGA